MSGPATQYSDRQSLLEAALSYAERGWDVLPLYHLTAHGCSCEAGTECKTPGKHPALPDWVNEGSINSRQIAACAYVAWLGTEEQG